MNDIARTRVLARDVRRRGGPGGRRVPLLLLAVAAFGLRAACAADAPDGAFEFSLSPGGFDERCLKIEAGRRIEYLFDAAGPVDFNVHHHRGKEVFFPVKQSATRGGDVRRFRAEATDDYCLMWENKGATPVRVTGRLQRLR